MNDQPSARVTQLLQAWCNGDAAARDRVFGEVYSELRRRARAQLARERPGHTLTPTALVHEAYLRLVGIEHIEWRGRAHFLAAGAGAMRRILVEHARAQRAAKRDGGVRVTLSDSSAPAEQRDVDVLTLHEALEALEAEAPRHAQLVELRFFGGLSIEEAADYLGSSSGTVKRDWRFARAWLRRRLTPG